MIEARNLTFQRADSECLILAGIDLRIPRGTCMGITGPSGSGKTTLAYHLGGFHHKALYGKTGGTLVLDGTDITRDGARGGAGLVLQNPRNQLFCETPREEIALGPENLGLPPGEIMERTSALLRELSLERHADHPTAALSLGLQQRVSVASMLALQPRVLILDEPTNFLDQGSARSLFLRLRALARSRGTTIVVIEHDLRLLREWADSVATLDRGIVTACGPPAAILPPPLPLAPAAASAPRSVSAGKPVLTVNDVGFGYRPEQRLLEQVSLTLNQGDIVALIGDNGAGKSTLLHLIKGLLSPQTGSIHLCGGGTLLARIGLVFQNPDEQIFAHSVAAECGYVLTNRGLDAPTRTRRVSDALAALGLGNCEARAPFSLSYGEKRRLSIASVLVDHPPVLCLDEPTVALDEANLAILAKAMKQAAADGAAILFATHDRQFAARVANRILALDNGRLQQLSTAILPEETK